MGAGVPLTAFAPDGERKRAAVAAYATQLSELQATVDGELLDDPHLTVEYAWRMR
jgi:hypothetical protein